MTSAQRDVCEEQLVAAASEFMADFVAELDESGVTGDCPCWDDEGVLVPEAASLEQSCYISQYANVFYDDGKTAERSYGAKTFTSYTYFDRSDANWK